jgi:hypothetical protein
MTPSLYYKIGVSYFLFVGMDYGPWTVFNSSTNFINFLVIYIYIYIVVLPPGVISYRLKVKMSLCPFGIIVGSKTLTV